MGAGYDLIGVTGFGEIIVCDSKQGALDFIADYIQKHPGQDRYRFMLDKKHLKQDSITKEDLDAICPDGELQIQEAQGHSIWVNSNILRKHGITDDIKDPVPGLSFYVRKDGHVTGEMSEGATELPIILDSAMDKPDSTIDAALQRWIDFVSVSVFQGSLTPVSPDFLNFMSTFILASASWIGRGSFRSMSTAVMSSRQPGRWKRA